MQQVREKLDAITQRSRSALSDSQVTEGDACVQAITELPTIDAMIELRQVEVALSQQRRKSLLYFVAGIVLIASTLALGELSAVLGVISFVAGLGLIYISMRPNPALGERRKRLQEQVRHGKQQSAILSTAQPTDLQQLRRERQQCIQAVMGQIEGYEKLLVG